MIIPRLLGALGFTVAEGPAAVRSAARRTRELWLRARGQWTPADKWDKAYASGRWDFLGRLDELARYSVLAGYAHALKPAGSVLDVGCGAGLLRQRLHPDAFRRYTGLDFAEAIARAAHLRDERTDFVVGDMTTHEPAGRFDVIVLSEVVGYFPDSVAGLARYAGFLEPQGVLLVSTFVKPSVDAMWAAIGDTYTVLDEVLITNGNGSTWLCKALARRDSPGA